MTRKAANAFILIGARWQDSRGKDANILPTSSSSSSPLLFSSGRLGNLRIHCKREEKKEKRKRDGWLLLIVIVVTEVYALSGTIGRSFRRDSFSGSIIAGTLSLLRHVTILFVGIPGVKSMYRSK